MVMQLVHGYLLVALSYSICLTLPNAKHVELVRVLSVLRF